jgi:hypothetical protein
MSDKYTLMRDTNNFRPNTIIFLRGKLYYIVRVSKLYIYVLPYTETTKLKYNNDVVFQSIGCNIAFITYENEKDEYEVNKERILKSSILSFTIFEIDDPNIFTKCLVSQRDENFNITFSHFIERCDISKQIKRLIINRDFINLYQCHQHHQLTIKNKPESTYYSDILETKKKDFIYNYITTGRNEVDDIFRIIDDSPRFIQFRTMYLNFKNMFLNSIKAFYGSGYSSASNENKPLYVSSSC